GPFARPPKGDSGPDAPAARSKPCNALLGRANCGVAGSSAPWRSPDSAAAPPDGHETRASSGIARNLALPER
ncbi:MAG: hypothetical protein ACRD2F_00095, partial [Terriglobales bacterium]